MLLKTFSVLFFHPLVYSTIAFPAFTNCALVCTFGIRFRRSGRGKRGSTGEGGEDEEDEVSEGDTERPTEGGDMGREEGGLKEPADEVVGSGSGGEESPGEDGNGWGEREVGSGEHMPRDVGGERDVGSGG
jgi:hypothetical protein